MANRLHQRLGGWVGLSNADLSERLTQMGHDQVDRKTLARARRLFTTALETPGGLKIQTIHAFCERILQLFPVEAGLAPGFAVLESSQSKQLLRQARDHVLRLAQGRTLEEALRAAVAAGSATVTTQATELCRREDVERLEAQLTAEALDGSGGQ